MEKQTLELYRSTHSELTAVKDEIIRLQSLLLTPTAKLINPQNKRIFQKKHAKTILQLNELEDYYLSKLNSLLSLQLQIETAIEKLKDPMERAIIRFRYIEGLDFFKVAIKLNYERAQTYRLHSRALKNLEKIQLRKTKKIKT